MNKCNRKFSVFTLVLLFASFTFTPVNLVMADEAGSDKATSDSGKSTDKDAAKDKKKKEKGKGKGKGDGEEEPDCE